MIEIAGRARKAGQGKPNLLTSLFTLLLLLMFILTGCATSQIATSIGVNVAAGFQKAAAKGEVSAEQSIKAWPYISGLIRGMLNEEYEFKVPMSGQMLMDRLDELAAQEALAPPEKGEVIGLYVRLESIAMREAWDRYGINLWSMFKAWAAGG